MHQRGWGARPEPPGPLIPARRGFTWGPLRHASYRWFFSAAVFANVGEWMLQFVLGWQVIGLAVREGHPERGPFYLGLLGLARLVPSLGLGLVGGVVADRFDRARVLLWGRMAGAISVAVLAALTLTDLVSIPLVMVCSVFNAAAYAFDAPARIALAASVVPGRDALSAIGLTRSVNMASSMLGPLLGGALIVFIDNGGVLIVASASSALAGLTLVRISCPPPPKAPTAVSPLRALGEGITYSWREPTLRGYLTAGAVYTICANAIVQILPAVAQDLLHVGAVELSWLLTASGLGAFIGVTIVASMGAWSRPGVVMIGSLLLAGLTIAVLSFQRTVAPAVLVCVVIGATTMLFNGGVGTIIQTTAEDHLRGRAISLQTTIFGTGRQAGLLILGSLGTLIGVANTLVLAGAALVVVAVLMWRTPVIRDVPRRVMRERIAAG